MSRHQHPPFEAPLAEQLAAFIDEHRQMLLGCLDGISEDEARQRLVPSKTTLLGLVKHATFVERVWFEETISRLPRSESGIASGPDESFDLSDVDTIDSVRTAYRLACEASRDAVRDLDPDHSLEGNRRGPLPLRWVNLHVLRELAQHCGHADILREQIIANRST